MANRNLFKTADLSVVLPNFNHAHFLSYAIQGLLQQALKPYEIIIIDDGSTDHSVKIIQKYMEKNSIIKIIKNDQNEGIISCLNHGLKLAKSRYIYFAAADDLVLDGLFEKSVNLLDHYPQAAFCSSLTCLIDKYGKRLRWPSPVIPSKGYINRQEVVSLICRYGFWLMGNTVVLRKQLLLEEGGFALELGPMSDYFVCQVMALKHGACFIPEYLGCMRRISQGYSISTFSDPKRSLKIIEHAKNLMVSRYGNLFPSEYIWKWEREWLYDIAVISGKVDHQGKNEYLRFLRKILSPLNWLDRLFLKALKTILPADSVIVKIYLLARLRLLKWEQIKTRFKLRTQKFLTKFAQFL